MSWRSSSGNRSVVSRIGAPCAPQELNSARSHNLNLPGTTYCQAVAELLTCPGPKIVDEVEEVQEGVATTIEPGLASAARVGSGTFDLGGGYLEGYAHAFEEGAMAVNVLTAKLCRGGRKRSGFAFLHGLLRYHTWCILRRVRDQQGRQDVVGNVSECRRPDGCGPGKQPAGHNAEQKDSKGLGDHRLRRPAMR